MTRIDNRFARLLSCALIIALTFVLVPEFGLVSYAQTEYADSFVKNGVFDTDAPGFPMDYTFKFSAGTGWQKNIKMGFFHAIKESNREVTLIDGNNVSYIIKPSDILDIPEEAFEETVKLGSRYRNTTGYSSAGQTLAADVGISADNFTMDHDFLFIEIDFPEEVGTSAKIEVALTNGRTDGSAENIAERFYNYAAGQGLNIVRYSGGALFDDIPSRTAVAKDGSNDVVTFNVNGLCQLLFTYYDLLPNEEEPEEPSEEEDDEIADFDESFIKDGQFDTSVAGFPESYTFRFATYNASNPGYSKELFQAIKNSGKVVTLIDRANVRYVFDGSKMADIPSSVQEELIQIQALYKNSTGYQTAATKIADKSNLPGSFIINNDLVILDFQPVSGTGGNHVTNNSFPVDATVNVKLTGGLSNETQIDILHDKFLSMAQQGKLFAYTYDKTSAVQDIFEDQEPIAVTATEDGLLEFSVKEPCTLIFTDRDLLANRNSEVDTNPYGMRIRKDGRNIGDGYTVDIGDKQLLELTMLEGNVADHEYVWEVIGPAADSIRLTEVEGSNNLKYELEAIKESAVGESFQINVEIESDPNIFVKTGTIRVVDLVYGKEFLENGEFDTTADGFPQDYTFELPSTKYRVSNEFFNAIAASGKKVTIIDPNNVMYVFDGSSMNGFEEKDWAVTTSIRSLYKYSASYQNVMTLIAYQEGIMDFKNYEDYIIIDFVVDLESFPVPVETMIMLEGHERSEVAAKHFADLANEGNLNVYAYSKTTQSLYRPMGKAELSDIENYIALEVQDPITLVFSPHDLMPVPDDDDWGSGDNGDTEDDYDIPKTGDDMNIWIFMMLITLSIVGIVYTFRKKLIGIVNK